MLLDGQLCYMCGEPITGLPTDTYDDDKQSGDFEFLHSRCVLDYVNSREIRDLYEDEFIKLHQEEFYGDWYNSLETREQDDIKEEIISIIKNKYIEKNERDEYLLRKGLSKTKSTCEQYRDYFFDNNDDFIAYIADEERIKIKNG